MALALGAAGAMFVALYVAPLPALLSLALILLLGSVTKARSLQGASLAIVSALVGLLELLLLVSKGLQRRLEARAAHDASHAPLAHILSALPGDMLQRIASFLVDDDGGDLTCFRLACRSFRAHSAPPAHKRRKAFLRSRARVAHAWSHPGFQLESGAMWRLAVRVGSVDVLDWLRSQLTGALDASICTAAARAGQLGALQWLRAQNCPWDRSTCAQTATMGHLEVLQWARAHNCPWDKVTSSCAAGQGHLEVLRWAREHGCDWDALTCWIAARRGHLEVLRWAREHGCPWSKEDTLSAAYDGDHPHVVAWIHAAPE